ncbi:MAG: hypothetical protein HND58_04825 [Planctomycetota bacterium]|nr:MAG: hypothetical protein HND58_04825 [Planctomycetota bacterium]
MPKTPDDWPEVVFRGGAITSAGIGEGEVAALIRELAQGIGDEPVPIVRRLVVADMPNYAEAIRAELGGRRGPTHTDRPEYRGVAQTIPTAHDDGTIDQTIVICSGPVAAALDCSTAIEPFMPKGLALYLLRHELAHCIDHLRRGIGIRVSFSTRDAFSVARVCDYYRPILMTELAACVFAGADLDDETFDLLMSLDQDPLESELQRVLDQRMLYVTRLSRDLHALALEAAGHFWFVLIQFAKVFGHMVGAKRTQASVGHPPSIAHQPDALAALRRLSELIGERVMTYPDWPEEGWLELDEIWSDLAACFGFQFEATDAGDALWLEDID